MGEKSHHLFLKNKSFCKQNKSSSPFLSLTPNVYPLSLLAFPLPSCLSDVIYRCNGMNPQDFGDPFKNRLDEVKNTFPYVS